MSIQVKDANGVTQTVKTLDDAFPGANAGATEVTSQDIKALADSLLLMAEMIRNLMPMPDSNDRVRVAIEQGSVGIANNSTLTNVSNVLGMGGGASSITAGLPGMGYNQPALQLITNQITVTP